jgi:hypothetical protein
MLVVDHNNTENYSFLSFGILYCRDMQDSEQTSPSIQAVLREQAIPFWAVNENEQISRQNAFHCNANAIM